MELTSDIETGAAEREVGMERGGMADGEDWRERFAEMLSVFDTEELIRFRHRLGKIGRERAVKILSLEIAEREKEPFGGL
jgi:hypothetical protein